MQPEAAPAVDNLAFELSTALYPSSLDRTDVDRALREGDRPAVPWGDRREATMTTTISETPAPDLRRPDPRAHRLWRALHDCALLTAWTPQRDDLWHAIDNLVCTQSATKAVPFGSNTEVEITAEYAHDELIAAIEWLNANEVRARSLDPDHLFATLRAVATRGANGSARAAQLDMLHGMTNVPPGDPVRWLALDEEGAA